MGKGACVESCSDGPRAICRVLQAILAGLLLFIGITCQFWAGLNVNDVPLSKLCNTYSGSPEVMTTDDFNQLADWFENQVQCPARRECFNFQRASRCVSLLVVSVRTPCVATRRFCACLLSHRARASASKRTVSTHMRMHTHMHAHAHAHARAHTHTLASSRGRGHTQVLHAVDGAGFVALRLDAVRRRAVLLQTRAQRCKDLRRRRQRD